MKHLNLTVDILIAVILAAACVYGGYKIGYVHAQIDAETAHLKELRLETAAVQKQLDDLHKAHPAP